MHAFPPSLAAIARRQHGLFTVSQARQCGLSRRTTDTLITHGLLRRIDREVLQHVVVARTWQSELLRFVLVGGSGAVASHRSAAVLWGIEGFAAGTPEVTVPRGRRLRRTGARVHESTDLDRAGVVRRDGIPTTDLPRTILDLARRTNDKALALAVQWCRRERGLTWTQLAAVLRRHARRGRPGIRRLRRVIAAEAHRDEISDSTFEELVIALLLESGLPEPVLHHVLKLSGRDIEIDLVYPEHRIAIELDGGDHMKPSVFRADRRRQNAIVLDGWLILRFTWDDYCIRPDDIAREVQQALRSRAAA